MPANAGVRRRCGALHPAVAGGGPPWARLLARNGCLRAGRQAAGCQQQSSAPCKSPPESEPLEGRARDARLPQVKRGVETVDEYPIRAEIPLTGGRTTTGVVRVGDTVRRPQGTRSEFVHRLLQGLASSGFTGAPRFLGIDDRQREILSFMPGDVPSDLGAFTGDQLDSAARLLRALHDATQDSAVRGASEVVCHGDPSPCNAVFMDGLPYAWIDFDAACPGDRSEDLGYAAWLWLDIGDDEWTPEIQSRRLARFFAEYGAAPTIVPVRAVLDAQMRLAHRAGAHQAWAERCRIWTERHQVALSTPTST
jgi:hypothetical protein